MRENLTQREPQPVTSQEENADTEEEENIMQGGGHTHPDGEAQAGGGVGEGYRQTLQTLPYEIRVGENRHITLTVRLDNIQSLTWENRTNMDGS